MLGIFSNTFRIATRHPSGDWRLDPRENPGQGPAADRRQKEREEARARLSRTWTGLF